jgi:ABC-type amino acid transport substrate-binding protein
VVLFTFGVSLCLSQCQALAAAVFGSTNVTNRYAAIPVTTLDRFTSLQSGNVDVLLGFSTQNMERQILEVRDFMMMQSVIFIFCLSSLCLRLLINTLQNTTGMPFAFSTPYLYSSLTLGGDKQYIECLLQYWNNDTSYLANPICDDIRICVRKGSYIAQKVSDMLDVSFTVTTSLTLDNFYGRYGSGDCTVLAADQFQVSKNVTSRILVDTNFENYTTTTNLLPIKNEPIGMITRKDDITWSDFVNWVVYGLLYSERKGYTRAETLANPDASYYAEWDGFGAEYMDLFLLGNQVVGHFGEIYERNLEQYVPRQTINTLNDGTMGGVIYSVSLGNLTGSVGAEPDQSSTLQTIQDRNSLNCGVYIAAIFAEKNLTDIFWL